jgi:hypothetical protein
METDIGTVEPSRIDFQGLRSDTFERTDEPQQQDIPMRNDDSRQRDMQWESQMQYYNTPQYATQNSQFADRRDIFAEMDRSTYIFIGIAFVVGFFIGKGMVQPVILKGH